MMKNIHKIASIALLLLFASCIKSDYDTENCPGYYTITPIVPVELQKTNNEFLSNSNSSLLYPTAEWRKTEVGPSNILELLRGQYRAYSIRGESNQVVIEKGTVITVNSVNGEAGDPGSLVGGYFDFSVEGGLVDYEVINFDLPTYIQSRELILKVKIEGDNSEMVESISATIDGIALSRDLLNAFIEEGERDRYPSLSTGFVSYGMSDTESDGYYTDTKRLLGLDGNAKQNLVLTIHYKDGFEQSFSYDVTTDLDGFHTQEVVTPWVISIVLRAGADFTATIEDWYSGPEEWMDAKPI